MSEDLTKQLTVLQTEFKLFRSNYDSKEDDRKRRVEDLFRCLSEIKKHIYSLPCKIHIEKMKAIDSKVNTQKWISGLVLSAIVGGFFWMIRS